MENFVKKFFLIFTFLLANLVKANTSDFVVQKSPENDLQKIAEYQDRCEVIKSLIINKRFPLDCFTNYNHYGPSSMSKRPASSIKIANYNLLHPGTSKALYKDNTLIAKIMNRYDIVAGLELLGTVGRDEQNNRAVLNLILTSAETTEKLRQQRSTLKNELKIQEINKKITKLVNDTRIAYDLYRAPGYLKILYELKRLDPSWSLILSPRGDSALVGSVEELVGYYYRASVVSPTVNPHCKEISSRGAGTPYACFISLTENFMGADLASHFARRPFMASFKANGKNFSMIASHMVFTYSGDEYAERDLMQKTFGVDSYRQVGAGLNSTNFARFAEVINTLRFMDMYRSRYQDERIMFMGDTNLVSNNAYWAQALKSYPGGKLLINTPTTLSPTRYLSNGKETNGVANDYDHFVIDKNVFSDCNDGNVYNYYKEDIYNYVDALYIIRENTQKLSKRDMSFNNQSTEARNKRGLSARDSSNFGDGDVGADDDLSVIQIEYPVRADAQSKMNNYSIDFENYLNSLYTVKGNEVIKDTFQIEERLIGLERRIFLRQLTNPFYYRFMQEILSDHFPVSITCRI